MKLKAKNVVPIVIDETNKKPLQHETQYLDKAKLAKFTKWFFDQPHDFHFQICGSEHVFRIYHSYYLSYLDMVSYDKGIIDSIGYTSIGRSHLEVKNYHLLGLIVNNIEFEE